MNAAVATSLRVVLVPFGQRRFALPADKVSELVVTGRPYWFPHNSPWIDGVIVRRGQIIPVCDISELLGLAQQAAQKYYLIVSRGSGGEEDRCAIPVSGDCTLAEVDWQESGEGADAYILGRITWGDDSIEVLDLDRLFARGASLAAQNADSGAQA